tara:strand:+ start:3879 stop:3986 length:108 start_codon:yes stop_codon:yes gene_type:complete
MIIDIILFLIAAGLSVLIVEIISDLLGWNNDTTRL